jgi:hypothetical protein
VSWTRAFQSQTACNAHIVLSPDWLSAEAMHPLQLSDTDLKIEHVPAMLDHKAWNAALAKEEQQHQAEQHQQAAASLVPGPHVEEGQQQQVLMRSAQARNAAEQASHTRAGHPQVPAPAQVAGMDLDEPPTTPSQQAQGLTSATHATMGTPSSELAGQMRGMLLSNGSDSGCTAQVHVLLRASCCALCTRDRDLRHLAQ